MKVYVVLSLALSGVWSIATGFPSGAIPLWIGAVAVAGRKGPDGIDSFYGVMLGGLLVACAATLVLKRLTGW